MNFAQARFNMIEQQIRTWDVLDQQVLDTLDALPRDEFVPPTYRNLAYSDTNIPLGYGEAMMTPKLEARIVQSLNLQASDRVLEVGTGSGYLTALLAHSAAHVTTIEMHETLLEGAQQKLRDHGINNFHAEQGDGLQGWKPREPYEAMVFTGSMATLPNDIAHQLTIGGRLFAVVGTGVVMEARLITRVGESEFSSESLFETQLKALIGAEARERFSF